MNLNIISFKKRTWWFTYPFEVILIDLDTDKLYFDYMDSNNICKHFKRTYPLHEKCV